MTRALPWAAAVALLAWSCTASDLVPLVPHVHNPDDIRDDAQQYGHRVDKGTGNLKPMGLMGFLSFFERFTGSQTGFATMGGGALGLLWFGYRKVRQLAEEKKRVEKERKLAEVVIRGNERALKTLDEKARDEHTDHIRKVATEAGIQTDLHERVVEVRNGTAKNGA